MAEELTIDMWKRVSRALDELLELDPDRRWEILSRICADDLELLRWTRTLLQAAGEAGDFLERSPFPEAKRLLLETFTAAGPGWPTAACSQEELQIEPDDIEPSELSGPGREGK
jgi:hypothetical protein